MTVEEAQALFAKHFGAFVHVVPVGTGGDYVGRLDEVFDLNGEGQPATRVWPSVFKDMIFTLKDVKEDGESLRVTTPQGEFIFRAAPDPTKK